MKQLVLSISIILGILACGGTKNSSPSISLIHAATDTWDGTLPCADCQGIEYKLELLDNGTYSESALYIGKSDEVIERSGQWAISSDSIIQILKENGETHALFRFSKTYIELLDRKGKVIDSDMHDSYRLNRIDPYRDIWLEKALKGIDFAGMGNEPFWNVQITMEDSISFSSLSIPSALSFKTPVPSYTQNLGGIRFHTQSMAGSMDITINKGKCIDDMSGEEFPFEVIVQILEKGMDSGVVFNGCGRYLGNPAIHDIWTLVEIGGEPVERTKEQGRIPTMEFNWKERKVSGNSGCNQYHGNFDFGNGNMSIGPLATTMMACPDDNLEDRFHQILGKGALRYEIEKGKLYLGEADHRMIFIKAD